MCSPLPRCRPVCEPPTGQGPCLHRSQPWAGPGQPSVGRMLAWGSLPSQSRGAASGGGSRPSSGIVAAAGVVNQADEQRILLPGYFTTPGLHHTHPLQASLVGPGGHGHGDGVRGERESVCERLFSLAYWISVGMLLGVPGELSRNTDASPSPPARPQAHRISRLGPQSLHWLGVPV